MNPNNKPAQKLIQFHRFPNSFGIALNVSWDKCQLNYENTNKVRYFFLAISLGPYQISVHIPVKIYGIKGVVK